MLLCFYKLLNCRHIFFKLQIICNYNNTNYDTCANLKFYIQKHTAFFLRKCSSIAGYCIAKIFKVPFGRCGNIGRQQKIVLCLSAFLLRLSMEVLLLSFVVCTLFLLAFALSHSLGGYDSVTTRLKLGDISFTPRNSVAARQFLHSVTNWKQLGQPVCFPKAVCKYP